MVCARAWGFLAVSVVLGAVVPAKAAGRCGDVVQRPWCDTALTPAQRTELLLAAMSLQQKLSLMAGDDLAGVVSGEPATGTSDGIPELGIPTLYLSDGPMGPRERQATAMPSPLALASTFNTELAHRVGKTIAIEVRLKGNDLVHAPTVDVMRTALAGRTFETYGEDPYLSSRLGVEWIRGVQSEGVIGNVKHFVMNTQEGQVGVPPLTSLIGGRQLVNAVVDERTLREIYLPPFEAAVKEADVGSVMCSYNYVNGAPACSSRHLLQEVLRDDWGFDGFVLSDYILAVKDTVQSANDGAELEMPIPVFYTSLLLELAVTTGLVSEETIDLRVGNILRTLFRFGFFDRDEFPSDDALIDVEAHAAVAREVEEQGIVLLKNTGVLPLDAAALHSIAVIGEPADRYRDVGGSASVQPFRFTSPRQAIADRAGAGVQVSYSPGSDAAQAAVLAGASDVALVFVADVAGEGTDKTCLSLDCPLIFLPLYPLPVDHPQDDLIEAVAAANPNTIVVMETGGPVLTPWREQVGSVLTIWYAGQEVGPALAGVLFGDVDASGRLPVTFMAAEHETPTAGNFAQYPSLLNQAIYSEGVFIGYRWYDQNDVAPAFPFGHGLSYTSFQYRNLSVVEGPDAAFVTVSLDVTNSGTRAGVAVPQVYIGMPSPGIDVPQPPKQLKGFSRQALAPGETRRVSFALDRRAFSYWYTGEAAWRVAPGCYRILAGSSSRDLPLEETLALSDASCDSAAPPQSSGASTGARFGGAMPMAWLAWMLLLAALKRRAGSRPSTASTRTECSARRSAARRRLPPA
jgi:beta-glucosidase